MSHRIPLTLVAREIQSRTGRTVRGSYRKLYLAVLDGRLPAEQEAGGRYTLKDEHLPIAEDILGLAIPADAA